MVTPSAFIIAEAGVNHNGDITLAKALIDQAAKIGANAVKFQTFRADRLVSKKAPKARYQIRNTDAQESQYRMIRKLELDEAAHKALIAYCGKRQITFLSSPFDEESADLLERLGVSSFKIPSGEITNEPFLKYLAAKNKPLILSTGMSTLGEVEQAIGWILSINNVPLTLLHCVTEYPTPPDQVNLRAIDTLRQAFNLPVGLSDHTEGIEIAIAAVARGAVMIEKHFTLDRNMPGPDHKASLEPGEFQNLVTAIRNVEKALGDGVKKPAPCELANQKVARKSLVAAHRLKAGHVLKEKDVAIKRPGHGLLPQMAPLVIGRTVRKPIQADEVLTWEHFR